MPAEVKWIFVSHCVTGPAAPGSTLLMAAEDLCVRLEWLVASEGSILRIESRCDARHLGRGDSQSPELAPPVDRLNGDDPTPRRAVALFVLEYCPRRRLHSSIRILTGVQPT